VLRVIVLFRVLEYGSDSYFLIWFMCVPLFEVIHFRGGLD